jgi:hypothetical protein
MRFRPGIWSGVVGLFVLTGVSCSSQSSVQPTTGQVQVEEKTEPILPGIAQDLVAAPVPRPAPAARPRRDVRAAVALKVPVTSAPSPTETAFVPPHIPESETAPLAVSPEPLPEPLPSSPEPLIVDTIERRITIPSGTLIPIRMIDSISSGEDHVDQTFRASIDAPVMIDGETVISRGTDAIVKLVAVQQAGKLAGKGEIKIQLDSIMIGDQRYPIDSNVFYREGPAQGAKTARSAGIGAAIGAAVGAIAGGGKGAIIGAGVGAGSGVAVEAVTKSEQARIESESEVTFRLEAPLELTK